MYFSKQFQVVSQISILSLYAEGDRIGNVDDLKQGDFNPLPLCRGRRTCLVFCFIQSFISILSLYAEGDIPTDYHMPMLEYFNPLPLCRGRLCFDIETSSFRVFQSSPSMQRETDGTIIYMCANTVFQSSPSMQRETLKRGSLL